MFSIIFSFLDHPPSTIATNGTDSSPLTGRHLIGSAHPSPAINGFLSNIERRVKAVVNISSTFLVSFNYSNTEFAVFQICCIEAAVLFIFFVFV